VSDGPGLQRALPRDAYVDDGVWALERERLFAHQWCAVARREDIAGPGDVLAVEVAGESVLLVRDRDGTLRGFYNLCRHRGSTLLDPGPDGAPCSSHLTGGIRCPYHAWTYGLDGSLRRTPFVEEVDRDAFGLHPVGVDAWGGWVFVHLTPEAAGSLSDQLGPIPERVRRYPLADLRRGARVVYDVAANWKVIAENYNECYHCGPVHPELCDLVPAFRGGRDLDWEGGVPHRDGAWTFTESGTSVRAPFPDLDGDERVRHKGELVYPNVLLSLAAEHVVALVLAPLAPGRTRVTGEFLFAAEEVDRQEFDPSDVVTFWDRINRQDWLACERVQRGMGSRAYSYGWFAPMEDDSADIRRWYGPLMGGG
jgi:Rieske 2Fe-2S family protein